MTNLLERIYDFAAGEVTADVNNAAVTTEKVDFDAASEGTTQRLVQTALGGADGQSEYLQFTGGVSTSSTAILDTTVDITPGGSLIVVIGEDSAATTTRFVDQIMMTFDGTVTVDSSAESSSPAGRTYSGSNGVLSLAMGADTYDIVTFSFGGRNT